MHTMEVSCDLLAASVASINVTPLQYDFELFLAPSVPNDGTAHVASSFVTVPGFESTLTFGGPAAPVPIVAGTFYAATNLALVTMNVVAGDRIGIRIRTRQASDPSAADITQLSFSATLHYTEDA